MHLAHVPPHLVTMRVRLAAVVAHVRLPLQLRAFDLVQLRQRFVVVVGLPAMHLQLACGCERSEADLALVALARVLSGQRCRLLVWVVFFDVLVQVVSLVERRVADLTDDDVIDSREFLHRLTRRNPH